MDYYIIWTGENEQFQKLVIDEFRKKGYRIYGDGSPDITFDSVMVDKDNDEIMCARWESYCEDHKEINFRELCELPPVHDEYDKFAEGIANYILNIAKLEIPKFDKPYGKERLKELDWCKVWKRLKPKLGL